MMKVILLTAVALAHALVAPARRAASRTVRGAAVVRGDRPVVLVGDARCAEETACLAAAAAARLGGAPVAARGGDLAALLGASGPRDVVYACDDDALDGRDRRALSAHAAAVWVRGVNGFGGDVAAEIFRDGALRKACRYEVCLRAPEGDDGGGAAARAEFGGGAAEVARLAAFSANPRMSAYGAALEVGADAFFVSLTFGAYAGDAAALAAVREIAADAAVVALEFRADLLVDRNPGAVLRDLAAVRAASAASWRGGPAKVMFTVRSASQAGAFPDGDGDGMKALLDVGLRAGVDWLDVEAESLPRRALRRLRAGASARGATLVLGSHHALGGA